MSDEDQEEKWIPFNIGYESYKKILNSLYRKKADMEVVSVDSISSGLETAKKYVSSALLFMKSLKIVEGDTKNGYKFTKNGFLYTQALLNGEEENIKQTTLQLIKQSHLKTFQDYLEINKENLTQEKLFKYVKTQARMPEGKGQFDLDSPYISGIKTLIKIFQNAKLIPDNMIVQKQGIPKKHEKTSKKSVKTEKKLSTDLDIQIPTDMERLVFGKSVIVLPKQNLKEEWEKLQKYMKLYLEDLNTI